MRWTDCLTFYTIFEGTISLVYLGAMNKTKLPKCCCLVIIVLSCLLFWETSAKSKVYTVGDADQWNTGINYLHWSEKFNFTVGDILVFKYEKGQHNAYEVTEATYQSCNASSGVLRRHESGDDQVNLTQAKKYWFICEINYHCLGGMRLVIDVKKDRISSRSNSTSKNNTTNGTSTSSNGSTCASKGWGTIISLIALVALPIL